jgi:AraC-like DNA-binding protein/mannose-6-phosphate isomerase-like protein (cupin superfamily)
MDKTCLTTQAQTPDGVHHLTRQALAAQIQRLTASEMTGVHIPVAVPLFCHMGPGSHYHSQPELFLQLSGTSRMHLTTGVLHVEAGDLLLVPRGVAHQETADSTRSPFCNLVCMHAPGQLHYHAGLPVPQPRTPLGSIHVAGSCSTTHPYGSRLYGYLNEAADFVAAGHPVPHPVIQGLLLAHLALLQTLLEQAEPACKTMESALVSRARRLVRERLAEARLCVQFLAEQLSCTPDYLSTRFHRETGIRLTAHINQERCHLARHLLRTTPWNIAEIAERCGYADPAYFSRVFSRQTGVHPREFRNRE